MHIAEVRSGSLLRYHPTLESNEAPGGSDHEPHSSGSAHITIAIETSQVNSSSFDVPASAGRRRWLLQHMVFSTASARAISYSSNRFTPNDGLTIKAVSVVEEGRVRSFGELGDGVAVRWVWNGEDRIGRLGDKRPVRSVTIYEEYHPTVQGRVMELGTGQHSSRADG